MANKLYVNPEATLRFSGEAGADVAFSVEGLATNAGRVSAQYDRGAGAQPAQYEWRGFVQWNGTPTKGRQLEFYLAGGDGTNIDGDVGIVDAALGSSDQLANITPIGGITVETANTTKMVSSGRFTCTSRYMTIVGFNKGGTAINATDSNFGLDITAIPPELQQ